MLAMCHQGVGIPLFWIFLDKKGNSNQAERKSLLKKFVNTFGAERIGGLLADREFIGKDWVGWLIEYQIPFVIRVKEDQHITYRGKTMSLRSYFAGLRPGRCRQLPHPVCMGNLQVFISAKRLDSGWLFLITPQYNPQAFTQYKQRWQIETLFKALKSQGFHLELTHITRISRLYQLLTLISIAFVWCYRFGEIRESTTPMRRVKQGTQRMYSLFQYGLNHLTHLLFNPLKYRELKKILALLSG